MEVVSFPHLSLLFLAPAFKLSLDTLAFWDASPNSTNPRCLDSRYKNDPITVIKTATTKVKLRGCRQHLSCLWQLGVLFERACQSRHFVPIQFSSTDSSRTENVTVERS